MHPNEGSVERCCGAHTAALTGTPSQRPGVTYTGQSQAAWSLAGNTSYVSYGGEFPGLNGINQQGLTRMAVRNLATNKRGPTYTTVPARTIPATTATRTGPGTIKVTFGTAWDYHNNRLTYDLLRDGNTTAPVYTTTVSTNLWTLPTLSFNNAGLVGRHYSPAVFASGCGRKGCRGCSPALPRPLCWPEDGSRRRGREGRTGSDG